MPELCIYRNKDECLTKMKMDDFNTIFTEANYKIATIYDRFDGTCYVFNPESIVKVSPISTVDRLLHLKN